VSIVGAMKSASARFPDAFWRGFEEARAEARAQSARSAAQTAASVDIHLARAFDSGVQAERAHRGSVGG
jgi:hypothetical protein